MADFEQDQQQQKIQRQPTASAPTAASAEGAMHETRMNVTRHRRAAMRKAEGKDAAGPQVDIPEGGGKQLDGGLKQTMERKLGADLSGVNIHTGGASAEASDKLNARAFTVGNDVHFSAGQFDPGSKEGTKLLAHELTHVVQGQKGGVQKKEDEGAEAQDAEGGALEVSDPEEPAEQEADAVAEQATSDMGEGGAAAEMAGDGDGDGEGDGDGVDAGGGKKAAEGDAGAAAAAPAEEAAPEAAAKLKAPISAKFNSSVARSILRKKASRSPDAEQDAAAEAKPAAEPEAAAEESKPSAEPEAASSDATAAAPEAAGDGAAESKAAEGEAPAAEKEEKDEKEEAPSQSVAAKLKGVHRKVFRAASTPPQPWPDYVNALPLPSPLKSKALALAPADQASFKGLLGPEQESYLSITSAGVQAEFLGLDNGKRAKVRVLRLEKAEHFDFYNGEADPAVRATWRDLTPDERIDLSKSGMADVRNYLTNSNGKSLEKFRKDRNLEVLRGNPALLASLGGAMGLTDAQTEDAVSALSAGQGGERVRRVMADTGFENPGDKISYLKEVWDAYSSAAGAKQPIDIMWDKRPGYVMKGKQAKNDAAWSSVPVAKAISLQSIGKWGTLTEAVVDQMAVAAKADPGGYGAAATAAPKQDANGAWHDASGRFTSSPGSRRADQGFKDSFISQAFPTFAKGRFSSAMVESHMIAGARGAASYWSADLGMVNLVMAGAEDDAIVKACAIDESPEYQGGFIVVSLPQATKDAWAAKAQGIRRPTAVDGLGFDQFKDAGSDAKCLGVTSGGMPEVVVEPVPLSSCQVIRS